MDIPTFIRLTSLFEKKSNSKAEIISLNDKPNNETLNNLLKLKKDDKILLKEENKYLLFNFSKVDSVNKSKTMASLNGELTNPTFDIYGCLAIPYVSIISYQRKEVEVLQELNGKTLTDDLMYNIDILEPSRLIIFQDGKPRKMLAQVGEGTTTIYLDENKKIKKITKIAKVKLNADIN